VLDVARLRRAVEHAEAHPEEFDMRFWVTRPLGERNGSACGTTACLAGTIVAQHDGYKAFAGWCADNEDAATDTLVAACVHGPDHTMTIRDRAAVLLGLDPYDLRVDELFGDGIPEILDRVNASNIREHVETVLDVTL